MNGLRPIKLASTKERVASELRKAILSKQIKEEEILSLESVANQLNVSVTPVREAFQILARDGLIKLRQNKGAIVLGINERYIREHYQIRAILESTAVRLVCSGNVDISEIENSYNNSCTMLEKNDFTGYENLNQSFHNEIWIASGNLKMKNMISELWNGLSMGSMVTESEYAKISIKEHGEIMKAMYNRDPNKGYDLMYQHIVRSMNDMLTHYK